MDSGLRIDDDLAALLLDASARLELRVRMRWECRATSVRAHMGVHNSHGLPLILGAGAHPQAVEADRLPDDLRAAHPSLDVNGSHRNRTGGREEWVERTHKHWFSEAHQDTVAYIPDDIPSLHQASRHAATWTRHRTSCGYKGPYLERLA